MTTASPTLDPKRAILQAFGRFEAFAGLLDIVPKSGTRIKLRLNEIQRAYCAGRTQRDVVLKPRQIGFTTLEQARDIYHFLTRPGARVVATCQSMTDHTPRKLLSENYEVMFRSLERLGVRLNFKTRAGGEWVLADKDATLRIVEAGASEAAAEKKGRAGTITRLHLTETAFYEYADATLNALLECVPAPEYGSEIVSESTPNGADGTFFRQCKDAIAGVSGFRFHFFPWHIAKEYAVALDPGEVVRPRTEREGALVERYSLRPEQLKWYQRKVAEKGSQDLVDQEYPSDEVSCFLTSGRHFFDAQIVALMMAQAEPPAKTQDIRTSGVSQQIAETDRGRMEVPALRIWHTPEQGREYVVACDTSEGSGGNAAAAIVLERGTGRHMATLWGQFKPWELAEWGGKLARKYNTAMVVVERNNHGHTVLRSLDAEQRYPRIFHDHDKKPGWLTNAASRPQMLDAFEKAVRDRSFVTSDTQLLAQMHTFVLSDNGKPEARKGTDDDLVMACGIGWDVICRSMRKRSEVQEFVP